MTENQLTAYEVKHDWFNWFSFSQMRKIQETINNALKIVENKVDSLGFH